MNELFKDWYRKHLWQYNLNKETFQNKEAVLSYMMACLSRGYIPNYELVIDNLNGKKSPNSICGYIDCYWDEEHVH